MEIPAADRVALRIERAPNVRNIEQYIDRAEEMADRKRTLIMS